MAVHEDVERAVHLAVQAISPSKQSDPAVLATAATAWTKAHGIAQANEGHPFADWLHAILHRIEGDEGNADYWYGQARRDPDAFSNASVELMALRSACRAAG